MIDATMASSSTALSPQEIAGFASNGIVGPKPLLSRSQCALIVRYLRLEQPPTPADWPKARAVVEPLIFELATSPLLLEWLVQLLGEDVILWGASVVERRPAQTHLWHTDIETSMPDARCVSAWIGLENVSRRSALRFVRGSHRFEKPIQHVAFERGLRRPDLSEATAIALAHEFDRSAVVIEPDASEGDALLFDGRIWHGSHNSDNTVRTALLLQYSDARTAIRIPDFSQLEWPFRFHARPRPPCIAVHGSASGDANRLVPRPNVTGGTLTSQFCELALPLAQDPARGWRPHPQFSGRTAVVDEMSCHVSVLNAGCCPHPPHTHLEEELLVVLNGEAELLIPSDPEDERPRVERLEPGSFVHYPAYQYHTIRNVSDAPVTYLMLKWRAAPDETRAPLTTRVVRPPGTTHRHAPFSSEVLVEGPTAFLGNLHVHVSELQPGAGYASHVDAHDVAMVVLSGQIEINNRHLGPHCVTYFPAGEPHDMKNPSAVPARYLVFEFHAPPPVAGQSRAARASRSVLIVSDRPYLPDLCGGRESSMHDLACLLQQAGHRVTVLARSHPYTTTPFAMPENRSFLNLARRFSVTALRERLRFCVHRLAWKAPYPVIRKDNVRQTLDTLLRNGRYDLAIVNVQRPHEFVDVNAPHAHRCVVYFRDVEEISDIRSTSFPAHVTVVANSSFSASEVGRRLDRSVPVIAPYVNRDAYTTNSTGTYVTYVNTVEEKGLDLAFEIARACPDISFLFLEGWPLSHERLAKIRRMRSRAANVTWRRRVMDMRPIYEQTRVLLAPSQWQEAWGRVVVEAQFSGIPTVGSDVGGLGENIGDAGLILDPHAPVDEWVNAVRSLWDNREHYERLSQRARRKADSYWKNAASDALRLLEISTERHERPALET
jgi:glycosyltransferase involved in cell wall biosynthesis